MARFGHRSLGSIASVLTLLGGMLLAPAPAVAAATCEVTNAGTGTTYTTLQEAVDDAASGDTLEVRGTCVGETVIRDTRLRLKGIATTEQPTPTLDGARLSRVLLIVSAKVVLRDLVVTNGKAINGGGIFVAWRGYAARPLVTLSGNTSVTGNTARDGGGMYNEDGGTVTLNDSSSVTGNTAKYGGGIYLHHGGAVTLNDSSSVTGNTAQSVGGGIFNYGDLTLNDSSSVTGNTGKYGGGISTEPDYATVGRVYVCSDDVAISPNDPDDPPKVRHVCA